MVVVGSAGALMLAMVGGGGGAIEKRVYLERGRGGRGREGPRT